MRAVLWSDVVLGRSRSCCGLACLAALGVLLLAGPGLAVPVSPTDVNLPSCDSLNVRNNFVDELGPTVGGFPNDERIFVSLLGTTAASACPSADTGAANVELRIRNRTGQQFRELWYVADPETVLANVDGLVNGQQAFRIDAVGANAPLVSESIAADGIFEDNELWTFIIDDYVNTLGLDASQLLSPGLVGDDSGPFFSSGSIIAFIPEPSSALLLGLGLAGLGTRRRARS